MRRTSVNKEMSSSQKQAIIPLIVNFYELLILRNCLFLEKLESQEISVSGKRNFAWTTQLFPKPFSM